MSCATAGFGGRKRGRGRGGIVGRGLGLEREVTRTGRAELLIARKAFFEAGRREFETG